MWCVCVFVPLNDTLGHKKKIFKFMIHVWKRAGLCSLLFGMLIYSLNGCVRAHFNLFHLFCIIYSKFEIKMKKINPFSLLSNQKQNVLLRLFEI